MHRNDFDSDDFDNSANLADNNGSAISAYIADAAYSLNLNDSDDIANSADIANSTDFANFANFVDSAFLVFCTIQFSNHLRQSK